MPNPNSPEKLGPAILVIDPSSDFNPKVLANANRLLSPLFRRVDSLRSQVTGLERLFLEEGLYPSQVSSNLTKAQPQVKKIYEMASSIDELRHGILLDDLRKEGNPDKEGEHLWLPEGTKPRQITLGSNLTLDTFWKNIAVTQHNLMTPITGLHGHVDYQLRKIAEGKRTDLLHARWAYYRLQGFAQNWERRAAGEFPEEKIFAEHLKQNVDEVLPHYIRTAMLEHSDSAEEADKKVGEVLVIPRLSESQKRLLVIYSVDWFREMVENISQNLLRQMEKKGKADHQIRVSFDFDSLNNWWEFGVHDNLTGWDPKMWVPGLGFRYANEASHSGHSKSKGIGMYDAVTALEQHQGSYLLTNNEMGGASQVYKFRVYKKSI
jgi:hypothetical protein